MNAYWCSFAFRKHVFDEAMSFMEKSTLNLHNDTPFESSGLYGCAAIEIKDYRDLGTWGEIRRLIHDTD